MVLRNELIGIKIKLLGKGIVGKIIDETKKTFVIELEKKRIRILKKDNIFEFSLNNKKKIVDGNKLIMRPEERIKIEDYDEK